MIIQEILEDNGNVMRTYSDQNVFIRQIETGIVYDEAFDVIPVRYTYEETDIPIVQPDPTDEEALAEIMEVIG